jgi:hypothetical protein
VGLEDTLLTTTIKNVGGASGLLPGKWGFRYLKRPKALNPACGRAQARRGGRARARRGGARSGGRAQLTIPTLARRLVEPATSHRCQHLVDRLLVQPHVGPRAHSPQLEARQVPQLLWRPDRPARTQSNAQCQGVTRAIAALALACWTRRSILFLSGSVLCATHVCLTK